MTERTVEELIAERIEKAAESYMMARAHKNAGKESAALAWALAGDYAQATADHLTRLLAENKRLSSHLDNESELIGSCDSSTAST